MTSARNSWRATRARASRPTGQALDVVSTGHRIRERKRELSEHSNQTASHSKKGMEQMSGAWSTGEFGTMLLSLFRSPDGRGVSSAQAIDRWPASKTRVYDYRGRPAALEWHVQVASQSMVPATGIGLDRARTRQVLRLEMRARALRRGFSGRHGSNRRGL